MFHFQLGTNHYNRLNLWVTATNEDKHRLQAFLALGFVVVDTDWTNLQ